MLSERVRRIGLSPTLRINAMAQELKAAGRDVLDLSAGQPDFPTPECVKEAGRRAIDENKTRYTPNPGIPELRQAVADEIRRATGVAYEPAQVLVSPGAKASLYFAVMALVDPGDGVLLPTPYWVSYPEQITLAEGEIVPVHADEAEGFKLTVDRLERARTATTRGLILNYPSNPTGACYSADELREIGAWCARHDVWVIADEIYSRLLYDGRRFASIAGAGPDLRERTVMVNGVSKSYSMTGWRIGYAAGPKETIAAMSRLQSHSTSNATSISQWASLEALRAAGEEADRRVAAFQERRDEIVAALDALPGVRCAAPEGSFYVFPNVSGCFGRHGDRTIASGQDLAEYLLAEADVAVVPGDAFGAPEHVRVSYSVSLDRIREGVRRIGEALARLGV